MASSVSLLSSSRQVALASSSPGATQCRLGGAHNTGVPPSKFSFVSFSGLRKDGVSLVGKDHTTSTRIFLKHQSRGLVVVASAGQALPSLNELPLNGFINSQGRIQPPVQPNVEASVFAVLDKNKKVQYIGFSRDIRNSLRTLMGRRPEFCYFYKLHNLPTLDQELMLAIRQQWMSELGASPEGNSDPTQRKFWEQPADAGSISERGKAAAAKAKAKTMQQMMADRGLKEEMEFDPKLLEEGKCDVLPSKQQSQEELLQASREGAEALEKRKEAVVQIPSGGTVEFELVYEMKFKTNGGWMYDVAVIKDDTETRHRIICGRIYPEAVNMPEDDFVEVVLGFLLHKKVPRHTEGLLDVDTFPINYFAVSEVAQRFDDLKDWFTGELPDNYWRFNRIHDYGPLVDPAPPVGPENSVSLAA